MRAMVVVKTHPLGHAGAQFGAVSVAPNIEVCAFRLIAIIGIGTVMVGLC
jgi:hypothetical protein